MKCGFAHLKLPISKPFISILILLVVDVKAPSVVVSEDARYLTGWLNVSS
jgi:hypothetical protein